MKVRALLLTAVFSGTLWLFLSPQGQRRREQLMGLMGRGPSDDSGAEPAAPLQFPTQASWPAEAQGSAPSATASAEQADTPAVASPRPLSTVSSGPAAPAPTPTVEAQSGHAAPTIADSPSGAEAPAVTDGPAGAATIQIEEVTGEHTRDVPTDEGAQPEAEPNPKLEEMLHELTEEIQVHAIGQESDVHVEQELDRVTIEEIGLPAEAPTETPSGEQNATTPAATAEPAAETRWVGNKRKMMAHAPGRGGKLPAPENRVYFDNREEAEKAGYTAVDVGD